jgi:hypothetical protein
LADLRPPDEGAETTDANLNTTDNDTSHQPDDNDSQSLSSSSSEDLPPSSSDESQSVSPDSSNNDISFDKTAITDNTQVHSNHELHNPDSDNDISYNNSNDQSGSPNESRSVIANNITTDVSDDNSRSASDVNSTLDAVIADLSNISDASSHHDDTSSSNEDDNEFLHYAVNPEISDSNLIEMEPDETRPGTSKYNLRKRTLPHGHNFYTSDIKPLNPTVSPYIFNGRYVFAMMQMTAKEGLRRFGEQAAEALIKEWIQLDEKDVFKGIHFKDVTSEQKSKALRLVQLIKEKRCGKIKGRTCADGRKQRNFINPDQATSPTVSTEALLLTLMVDAHECRDVATCDISGAFLQSDMDEFTLVVVDGALVDMLIRANKEFKKFVHIGKNGRKVVYLQLKKALYGTLRAARLFWENLTDKLEKKGFILNPYDSCVANKIINGHQCTITWHVDDLKISHKDPAVTTEIIDYLESIFGEMTVM